jgi:3-hydroxyacyl-[acyl-carrier-protein] dehydratase
MPPVALIDTAALDTSRILYDQEAIRAGNPQRFEMEHLTAIVLVNHDEHVIAGYKDVTNDEFWVRGHMPGFPLMPGVIMCEVAAQLCSFYSYLNNMLREGFLAFGGMEDVRFRGPVRPGDRFIIAAKTTKMHRRQMVFETQGFVNGNMVYHGTIIGVPLALGSG